MDPEIQELKELVKRQAAKIDDTNRVVHSMRRSSRMRTLLSILWWVAILGLSAASYYYYIQPYVDQFNKAYGNTKNFELQVQNWFAQFGHTNKPSQ